MVSADESPPLVNDPAREAAASMRGYWAQIWRSVLVWMELDESERLYLEGAEDFDRVSGLAAETVQVKDVAGNVTLRSSDVVEAICNAWDHEQRNPRRAIRFRFLTTAGIGVEQGAPFGTGIGGLQLWRDCRLSGDAAQRERDARAIADFLLKEGKVSVTVQAFLCAASDAEIWQRLIALIEWDADAEESPDVIREIKNRLVVMGQSYGVTPDKAEEVADHLYTTAYGTATRQGDRYLVRADLLRQFQERTHLSLPAALFAAISQHLVPTGPLPMAVGGKRGAVGRPLPLPARYHARQAVLADIAARLSAHPVLVLQGGTGVGKSIAAVGHLAVSTSSWGWVDLRGVSGTALMNTLDRVVAELVAEDGLTHIVLDDIELPPDARPLETPLVRIKTILGERGGELVITSTVALTQRLSLALGLPASATMSIPAFTRDEIMQFLNERGCPGPQVAGWWAAFVELQTSGHAQLVHARIATLEAQGFPTPDMKSVMVTPSDVVEARSEARRLVTALDAPTRELIYRLSLTVQALPRRQVFAIAGQPPPIAEPGLAFDRLIGPWLEMVAEGLYRVSPLLRGIGPEVQGEAWATAMHSGIAHALLGFRTLSPTDVSTILFHAIAAQDWPAVTHLSIGIFKSDNETWEALAQSADWFVLVGTGSARRPETDVFSLFAIRLLQFRLAAAGHDDRGAASVVACIDEELGATVEGTPLRLARHLFLGQVLLHTEVNLPMALLVSMGLEYVRLSDELNDVLAEVLSPEFDHRMAGPDGAPDLANVAGSTLTTHLTDRLSLAALLEACEPVEADAARRLLWFFGGRESIAQLVFDRVWLAELKAAPPDWLACREVFERACAFARRCTLSGLAQGTARAIARLVDENLNDAVEALRLADAMAAEIGRSPGQDDERATILLHKGDTADALAIWRELLPRWTPRDEFDLQQTFSHRLAAVAAARLGEWTESADWLRSARALADEVKQTTYCAGLLVDEGFARWKGGDNRGALDCLARGLTAIDRLASDDADENAYLLRKRAGHTMMWIANNVSTLPKEFSEPPPACCSSLEPVKEARGPSTPSDAMWTHILQFEFAAELGDEQFRTHEAGLKASRYGVIRYIFDRLRLQHRLRNLAFDDFVEVVGDHTDSFALCRHYYKEGGLGPADPLPADATAPDRQQSDAEVVLSMMLTAIVALAARASVTKERLDQWKADVANAGLSDIVAPWLAFATAVFIDNTIKAEVAMRDQSPPWTWQAVASIRVAIDDTTRPAELMTVHWFWTSVLPNTGTGLYVLAEVEQLVTRGWLRLSELGFLLRAPAVTVPALLQACASASSGWRKIGEVLSAACDAVPAAVPSEFREKFRQMTLDL
jgi:tetratricopeptide (TPR) repeat protein